MEDIETLKKFIEGSGLSKELKKALFDCVLLEMRNSPTAELLKVVKNFTEMNLNEN
jgi:hypothetical protein